MSIDLEAIRANSLKKASQLGYPINPHLPILEVGICRDLSEIAARMLCLNVTLATAFGYPRDRALMWLEREQLTSELALSEQALIDGRATDVFGFQAQVDALFGLAWATSLVPRLEFDEVEPESLVKAFPNLNENEPVGAFVENLTLRPGNLLLPKLDLAYCLHWAISDALLKKSRPPGKLHPVSVIERRRALEWIYSPEDWDNVSLDT